MNPYWTSADGNLTIYHGDARDVLPELDLSGVDLVLTDPPYGIELFATGHGKSHYLTRWDYDTGCRGACDRILYCTCGPA